MTPYTFLPLWLPVWLFSTLGLACLAVYHHHRQRHSNMSRSLIDDVATHAEPIASMKAKAPVHLAAFRAGDYLLHTIPMAFKLWWFDLPRD